MRWYVLDVFPARAGMNRWVSRQTSGLRSVPRAGGDEPQWKTISSHSSEYSPRGRG